MAHTKKCKAAAAVADAAYTAWKKYVAAVVAASAAADAWRKYDDAKAAANAATVKCPACQGRK